MNEVYKHTKLDDQKVMIKDYMVNTFYGMKITCCQHLLSQDDVSTILKTSSKTSILNSHEYRCLHCLHPVNCFLPKSRQRCGLYGRDHLLLKDTLDEYDMFEVWVQTSLLSRGKVESLEQSFKSEDQTVATRMDSAVQDCEISAIIKCIEATVRDTSNRLLNTAQISREKLSSRPLKTINDIFHAILSQHIATAYINDPCVNVADLWRSFADSAEITSLDSTRQACHKSLAIVASYGWSIFTYSHLVCHVVRVELASTL